MHLRFPLILRSWVGVCGRTPTSAPLLSPTLASQALEVLMPPAPQAAVLRLHARAPPRPRPWSSHRSILSMRVAAPSNSAFERWAQDKGISAEKLRLQDFDGERGVGATAALQPGERILAVPSQLALQVTTTQRTPGWLSEDSLWQTSPWHHRLALTLLHEEGKRGESELQPWLAVLPRSFSTPIFWTDAELARLDYAPVVEAVEAQRVEWDGLVSKLQRQPPSGLDVNKDSLYRALSVVRSRSFSGPYAGGTFKGSLLQLFLVSTIAAISTLTGGNAELALDGFLGFAVYILANDLFFSRGTNAKRYVLCPFIDMMNHASSRAATDVAYEYFTDNFAVVLDDTPVKQGEESKICYGPRSNDALLQYYGFIEESNPHDTFQVNQQDFLVTLAQISPYDPAHVRSLASEALPPSMVFTPRGVDDTAFRITRLVLFPSEAAAGRGVAQLPLSHELEVMQALAAVAKSFSARFAPAGSGVGFAEPSAPPKQGAKNFKQSPIDSTAAIVASFRSEKSKLLASSGKALLELAAKCEEEGMLIQQNSDDKSERISPGFGLTKIS